MADAQTELNHDGNSSTENEALWLKTYANGTKRFWPSGKYADIAIVCQDVEWKVHRAQISALSDWFETLCDSGFKEAGEARITLVEDDPSVVGAMLNFMYTGDYTKHPKDMDKAPVQCTQVVDEEREAAALEDHNSLIFDIQVHIIANKYFIPALELLAAKNFAAKCKRSWHTTDFADAAAKVYVDTSEGSVLREIIVDTINTYARGLLDPTNEGLPIQTVLRTIPALGGDVLLGLKPGCKKGIRFSTGESLNRFKMTVHLACNYAKCDARFRVEIPFGTDMGLTCPRCQQLQMASYWLSRQDPREETVPNSSVFTFECPSDSCTSVFTTSIRLGVLEVLQCPHGHHKNHFHHWKQFCCRVP